MASCCYKHIFRILIVVLVGRTNFQPPVLNIPVISVVCTRDTQSAGHCQSDLQSFPQFSQLQPPSHFSEVNAQNLLTKPIACDPGVGNVERMPVRRLLNLPRANHRNKTDACLSKACLDLIHQESKIFG